MYLGARKVRSAGRNSGSVEFTLPALLQDLEGVECRLVLRDGPRPELVLQPDMSAAFGLLERLWHCLVLGVSDIDDLGEFVADDFTIAFLAPRLWQDRPPLALSDVFAIHRHHTGRSEALSRVLAVLAVVAAQRLGLEPHMALAFGDAVAYAVTHVSSGLGTDFERGMAHQILWEAGALSCSSESPLSDTVWQQMRPALSRVYAQLRTWQEYPATYQCAHDQWYRALIIERGAEMV